MTTTLRPSRPSRQSGRLRSRPVALHTSRHAQPIAAALGCTELTAQKYLCTGELEHKLAVILRQLVLAKDRGTLERIMRPIDAALAGLSADQLTEHLTRDAQLLDLSEDAAEAEWHAAPSRESLRRWQLARLKAPTADRRLDAAIAEELARAPATPGPGTTHAPVAAGACGKREVPDGDPTT